MEYEINGTVMPVVEITLDQGESVFTESGGMAWMDNGIAMETNSRGGLGKMLGRALSGESLFMTTYTAEQAGVTMGFTPEVPGNIIDLTLQSGEVIIAQRDAFMFAESSVELAVHFRRKLGAGIFGGEGLIMQRITGPGTAFFEVGGEVIERQLEAGQVLKVDPGHVALHDSSIDYDIEMVKGLSNMFFGGEGLFLAKLTGPGRVWLQTMPLINLAGSIGRYIVTSS